MVVIFEDFLEKHGTNMYREEYIDRTRRLKVVERDEGLVRTAAKNIGSIKNLTEMENC